MAYNGSLEHKVALHKALNKLQADRISSSKIIKDFKEAVAKNEIENISEYVKHNGISRQLVDKYKKLDPSRDGGSRWRYEYAQALFDFLEGSEKYQTPHLNKFGMNIGDEHDGRVVLAIMRHFRTNNSIKVSDLDPLVGIYAMFRPAWSSKVSGRYLRSIVKIERVGDLLSIEERQDYFDDYSNLHVDEHDKGYLIVFGNKVFSITKESKSKCMKFLVINEFSSLVPGDHIAYFTGNVMGVSHQSPSDGYPFICRRVLDGNETSEVFGEERLDAWTRAFFDTSRLRQR